MRPWARQRRAPVAERRCDEPDFFAPDFVALDFLAPGFLGKLSDFQKNYVKPIEDGDDKVLEALRVRVRPFVMRRKKEDVAKELPAKTEQTLYCQLGRSQLGLYNRILKLAKEEITGRIKDVGIDRSQMTILAALMVFAWVRDGSRNPDGILFSLCLYGLLLLPHMERYNHILALPAIAWLWARGPGRDRKLALGVYLVFALSRLNHLWALVPSPVGPIASGFGLFGVLLLLAAMLRSLVRPPETE